MNYGIIHGLYEGISNLDRETLLEKKGNRYFITDPEDIEFILKAASIASFQRMHLDAALHNIGVPHKESVYKDLKALSEALETIHIGALKKKIIREPLPDLEEIPSLYEIEETIDTLKKIEEDKKFKASHSNP
jgi:hypothetical protein